MLKLANSKSVTDFLTSWLTVIALVSAAIFGILEYVDHKQDVRVQRSLDYVERYNKDLYLKLRDRLADVLDQESKTLIATLVDDSLSKEQIQRKYFDFINEMIAKHKLTSDLRRLLGFHEEVVLCVNAGICDAAVVRSFFSVDAQELFRGFYPYICDQRDKWKNPTIAAQTEKFFIGENIGTCTQ
jgi:hypothetical protein